MSWLSSSAQNAIYKFASLEFDGLVHCWKEQRLISPISFYCATFTLDTSSDLYPPSDLLLWNSSPTTSDRASFPNLDWTQANTGVGLIQCLGPKYQFVCSIATIWMLKFYAVQVLCRSKSSKSQTTWEPPAFPSLLLQDFRLTGMLSADPKARKFEAFSFRTVCHFVGNWFFFCQENPVFHNWTLVYVPYCDGTSFSGDAVRSGVAESVKGCVLAILVGVFVGAALPLVIWLRDTEGYQKCSLQLMCGRQTPFALGLPIANACRLSQLSDKEVAPVIPVYCVQPYAPHVLEPLVWILDHHCT